MNNSTILGVSALLSLAACSGSSSGSVAPGAGTTFPSVVVYTADAGNGHIQAWRAPVDNLERQNLMGAMPLSEVVPGGMSLSPDGGTLLVTTEDAGTVRLHSIEVRTGIVEEVFLTEPALAQDPPLIHWSPKAGEGAYVVQHGLDATGLPGRSTIDAYLGRNDQSTPVRLNQDDFELRFDSWSLDGARFLARTTDLTSGESSMGIHSDHGTLLADPLAGQPYSEGQVQWTPEYMGFSTETIQGGNQRIELQQHDLVAGTTTLLSPTSGYLGGFQYSSDGSLLVMELGQAPLDKRVVTLAQSNPAALQSLLAQERPLRAVNLHGWSSSQDLLALSYEKDNGSEGEILITTTRDAHQIRLIESPQAGSQVYEVVWSPDGNSIAFTSDHEELGVKRLYIFQTGFAANLTSWDIPATAGSIEDLTWSPDSNWIFTSFKPTGGAFKSVAAFENHGLRQGTLLGDRMLNMAPQTTSNNPMPNLQPAVDSTGVVWVQQDGITGLRGVVFTHVSDANRNKVLSSSDGTLSLTRIFQFFVR